MSNQSPPKRPRLSLQIKALSTGPSIRTSRTLAAIVNPSSPTSFNTLSNVYSTAIDRSSSTPVLLTGPAGSVGSAGPVGPVGPIAGPAAAAAPPLTAVRKHLPALPRLQVPAATPVAHLPETPLSPNAARAAVHFPSAALLTPTPPLSAGPADPAAFCFSPDGTIDRFDTMHAMLAATAADDACSTRSSSSSSSSADEAAPKPPAKPARRALLTRLPPPYKHPRALHSILRNSPLPPPSAQSPVSPRRQSQRLLDRASRHVMYNSPLTQTITTNTYTRSHIDLLCEDTSPASATQSPVSPVSPASPASPCTTPAPLDDMRRRMAGLSSASTAASPVTSAPSSPTAGGIRKRRQSRRDRRRRWVWTLGQDDDDNDNEEHMSGAMAALKAAQAAEEAAKKAEQEEKPSSEQPADPSPQPPNPLKRKSTPDLHGDEDHQPPLKSAWMRAATSATAVGHAL